jgi:hypothetical protein
MPSAGSPAIRSCNRRITYSLHIKNGSCRAGVMSIAPMFVRQRTWRSTSSGFCCGKMTVCQSRRTDAHDANLSVRIVCSLPWHRGR